MQIDELTSDIEEKSEEEKKEVSQQHEYESLIKQIKEMLGDQVKEVRLSHRLTTSPACLVRDQNALGPQMERLLRALLVCNLQ